MVLKIFLGQDWDPHRDVMARITIGMIKASMRLEELHVDGWILSILRSGVESKVYAMRLGIELTCLFLRT